MSRFTINTSSLTTGALGGGAAIASALWSGVQQYRQVQRDRWNGWTSTQLKAALDSSERMRFGAYAELNRAKAEIADLKRQVADLAFVLKRERVRSGAQR